MLFGLRCAQGLTPILNLSLPTECACPYVRFGSTVSSCFPNISRSSSDVHLLPCHSFTPAFELLQLSLQAILPPKQTTFNPVCSSSHSLADPSVSPRDDLPLSGLAPEQKLLVAQVRPFSCSSPHSVQEIEAIACYEASCTWTSSSPLRVVPCYQNALLGQMH